MEFKRIELLVLDFDGVLTNNKVYLDENGKETVRCDRSDGLGIEMANVEIIVLSKEKNKVVSARCKKLGIECAQGVDDKVSLFKDEVMKRKLDMSHVCFIGNDVNDIECIKLAGIGVAVADAHPDVLKVANYVSKKNGGDGAVREVLDLMV